MYYLCAQYIYIFKVPKYHEHAATNNMRERARSRKTRHDAGAFKAVQTHVDHSDASAIVTAAGCPLGQIWRIVGLGWRSLCNRR